MIIVGVIIIALILIASVAVIMMSNNDGSNNSNNANNDDNGSSNGDGSSGGGDGDGDNGNGGNDVETGTWVNMSGNIEIEENQLITDVQIIGDEVWFASMNPYGDITVYYSTDGGQTFEFQDNEYGTYTTAIFMLNTNEGYIAGYSGIVYRTSNSGTDWVYHGSIGGPTISDITFPPGSTTASTGYGCGDSGNIFEITSSGITKMTSNLVSNMASITFPSAAEGWVCGENTIRHYTDGAWTADQSYPSGGYNSIYFVPGTTQGWCVGDTGRILHTTDGMSWQIQTNPDSDQTTLLKVFFYDTLNGWAVGHKGIILHTTDGGANWNIEGEGLTNNGLEAIFFTSSENGYILGANGTIIKFVGE